MNIVVVKMLINYDVVLIKVIKIVYWFVCENLLLLKFESMMDFLKDIGILGFYFLKVGNWIDY